MFFAFYLFSTLAIALRLGWHMATRLDHFDWHYGEPWLHFMLTLLLWPLLLLRPHALQRALIAPDFAVRDRLGINLAARARALAVETTPAPVAAAKLSTSRTATHHHGPDRALLSH